MIDLVVTLCNAQQFDGLTAETETKENMSCLTLPFSCYLLRSATQLELYGKICHQARVRMPFGTLEPW